MQTKKIEVNGMACDHCKMAVEKGVEAINGVKFAKVDLVKKVVIVEVDEEIVSDGDIYDMIDKLGFEAVR